MSGAPALVREARVWAENPKGVLYVPSSLSRRAYGVAVAVSERAVWAICDQDYPPHLPFAVGLLDELSVPEDPDPDYTAQVRDTQPVFSSIDTHEHHLALYADRLREAPLTLLRPPTAADADGGRVLDGVVDFRYEHMLPTLVAGVVTPDHMAAVYGLRIARRLGFADPDGRSIGLSTPDAAALDVDRPPGE